MLGALLRDRGGGSETGRLDMFPKHRPNLPSACISCEMPQLIVAGGQPITPAVSRNGILSRESSTRHHAMKSRQDAMRAHKFLDMYVAMMMTLVGIVLG
jgi:hypothetical protein